jgi:hypothetical protein
MMGRFGEDRDERSNSASQSSISLAAFRCPTPKTVFRTLAAATGSHLKRLPDGEIGIRKTWIRFLQQVLADNPGIEVASDVPAFKFNQWDGKLLREIPRLRLKPGARLDPATKSQGPPRFRRTQTPPRRPELESADCK